MTAYAVVTGGGTSGHVLPALAVADALVARGHDPAAIHYVGAARGIETRLLPSTPYPHTFFEVDGLQRSFGADGLRRNAAFAPKMWRARRAAIRLLRELAPKVVVSVGGYASMPAVFAARKLRVPIVVVSFDRTPGLASKLASRSAAACAVAFEESPLPRAVHTGAPVRQVILGLDRGAERAAARDRLGLDADRFVVAVMGGSLGSRPLNRAVDAYLEEHRDDAGLAVRQVAGERFAAEVVARDAGAGGVRHQVVGYEPDMAAVYAAADLFVGRGGASTVHEVAATGIPAILVPWAGAAENHQGANVRWLSERGAAVLLPEDDLDRLGAEIERLRSDPASLLALGRAAAEIGQLHRSGALAALVEEIADAADPDDPGASMRRQ